MNMKKVGVDIDCVHVFVCEIIVKFLQSNNM